MSETRDVYFWSQETGLIELPGAIFHPNPREEKRDITTAHGGYKTMPTGLAEAEPTVAMTVVRVPDGISRLGVGSPFGLLWTTRPTGDRAFSEKGKYPFPYLIPARVSRCKVTPRLEFEIEGVPEIAHPRIVYDIEIEWRSVGPFVAEGFSHAAITREELATS